MMNNISGQNIEKSVYYALHAIVIIAISSLIFFEMVNYNTLDFCTKKCDKPIVEFAYCRCG